MSPTQTCPRTGSTPTRPNLSTDSTGTPAPITPPTREKATTDSTTDSHGQHHRPLSAWPPSLWGGQARDSSPNDENSGPIGLASRGLRRAEMMRANESTSTTWKRSEGVKALPRNGRRRFGWPRVATWVANGLGKGGPR